jgi:hypothetical protein
VLTENKEPGVVDFLREVASKPNRQAMEELAGRKERGAGTSDRE